MSEEALPIFYGEGSDLRQLPDIKAWNKRTGWTITRPFSGSRDRIEEAAVEAVLAGIPILIEPGQDGLPWKVNLTYGAEETQSPTEPVIERWERPSNDLEKELWELPFVVTEFQRLMYKGGGIVGTAIADINSIRNGIERYVSGEAKFVAPGEVTETALSYDALMTAISKIGADKNVFIRLIALFARGVKAFPVPQYVLRRTRIVASNFSGKPVDDDVFTAVDTARLKSKYKIPNTVKFNIPDGVWVKQPANITDGDAGKTTIIEEWKHADAAEIEIYGVVNTAADPKVK